MCTVIRCAPYVQISNYVLYSSQCRVIWCSYPCVQSFGVELSSCGVGGGGGMEAVST